MSTESKSKAILFVAAAVALVVIVVYGIFSGRETEIEIPGGFRARIGEETASIERVPKSPVARREYMADYTTDTTPSPPSTAQILSVGSIRSCIKQNETTLVQASITPRELVNTCFVSGRVPKQDFDLAERQELLLAKKLKMTFDAAYAVAEVGYELYERGEYVASRIFFEAMVLLNYADAYFNNMVGSSYMAQKDLIVAVDSFNKAIQFDPDNGHALLNRGECLYLLGDKDKALRDFKRVIALQGSEWADSIKRARWILENYY